MTTTAPTNVNQVLTEADIEQMKREQAEYELALQLSLAQEEEFKQELNEEEEMIRLAMEMSVKEENARLERMKS